MQKQLLHSETETEIEIFNGERKREEPYTEKTFPAKQRERLEATTTASRITSFFHKSLRYSKR
jgi:hypothetical protein